MTNLLGQKIKATLSAAVLKHSILHTALFLSDIPIILITPGCLSVDCQRTQPHGSLFYYWRQQPS